MVIIEIKIIDESKTKAYLLPKMSNKKKMSL